MNLQTDCKHWSECGVNGGGCCGLGLYGGRPSRGVCLICKSRDGETPTTPVVIGYTAWPWPARTVRLMRKCGDRGVGDTVERLIGLPGTGFKSLLSAASLNCGCANRRDVLNRRYPYEK